MRPGLTEGLMIQRKYPPSRWRAEVDKLQGEVKAGAEQYLADQLACHRARMQMARECGCKSMREFEDLRKEARRAGAPGARAWVNAGRPLEWRNGVDAPSKKRYLKD